VEKHFPLGTEDGGETGVFHTGVVRLSQVGEKRITFLAAARIFEVVAKLKRMVEVETNGPDYELCERVKRAVSANDNFSSEIVVFDFEVVFLHGCHKKKKE
jgi:hypothetical protein